MKKMICAMSIIAILCTGLNSCKPKNEPKTEDDNLVSEIIDNVHTSKNSLDWNGSYSVIEPCADCEGISVTLTLNLDETYQLSYQYLGKKDASTYLETGKFTWDDAGSTITLDCKEWPPYYKVGENQLIQLDMAGNLITGELANMYILTKKIDGE